jgi:hypothetical protein
MNECGDFAGFVNFDFTWIDIVFDNGMNHNDFSLIFVNGSNEVMLNVREWF